MDVDTFLWRYWGINSTREYSFAGFSGTSLHTLQIIVDTEFDTYRPKKCGCPDQTEEVYRSVRGGASHSQSLSRHQLSMHQPLSTSTALPAPLPCVDGQWHRVQRSPGSPPAPAADFYFSSSSSCSDRPHLSHCPCHLQTLKTNKMHLTYFFHTHHPHPSHRMHLPRGCHKQQMCPRRQLSGGMCGVAIPTCKAMSVGENCSPTRNSSFALTRKEKLTAPRVRMILTVSTVASS